MPPTTPPPLTAATVRSVTRALEQILAEIVAGKAFQITRLTRIKRLCTDTAAAGAFALFIAERSLQKLEQRKRPDSVTDEQWNEFVVLARDGVRSLAAFCASQTTETEREARAQRSRLYAAQNTYKNLPYISVRVIVCWEAMQVETALACALERWPHEQARYGYQLASDYVKRFESTVQGGDLNRSSAEPLAEVIAFWQGYAERLVEAERSARVS